jgi:hypothetical protein
VSRTAAKEPLHRHAGGLGQHQGITSRVATGKAARVATVHQLAWKFLCNQRLLPEWLGVPQHALDSMVLPQLAVLVTSTNPSSPVCQLLPLPIPSVARPPQEETLLLGAMRAA